MSRINNLEEQYIEAEDLYDTAMEWLSDREFHKAVELLKRVITLNPNFIYAYISLSEILSHESKYNEAIHFIDEAQKIDSDFSKLSYLKAKYNFKKGDFKRAKRYIEEAIDMDPQESLYLKSHKIIMKHFQNNK